MTKTKTTAIGLGITAIISGGMDASVLNEEAVSRVEIVANERVEAKQVENTVETKFPWKGERGLTVKYDMGEPSIRERFADKRDREVITEVVDFGEGGFKIDILLNERPATNRFCYEIAGAENYDFFYQPEITDEEAEASRFDKEDTRTLEEIKRSMRSEDIVGSYAVYHKSLKNNNYQTGKVMHIPRPQVWELNDEENTKEWAELSYNEREGLCVTARQEFLDEAEYPARIDPTFGYTSVGATNLSIGGADDGYPFGGSFAGVDGTLDSVHVALRGSSGAGTFTIGYRVSNTSANSTSIFSSSESESITTTPTFYSMSAGGEALSSSGTLYLTHPTQYIGPFSNKPLMVYDSVGSGGSGGFYDLNGAGTWVNQTTINYSIYATYTEAPAATSTPQSVIFFD